VALRLAAGVTVLPGPVKVACPCGCDLFGTPTKKFRHVRACQCRRCRGSRTKSTARRRENRIAKDTGGERSILSGQLSGYDGRAGLWVWEETSNQALTRGLRRWWESGQVRSKMGRLFGLRGVRRAFVASWDGKPQLVVVPYEDWVERVKEDGG
jgi:hypothetical protein